MVDFGIITDFYHQSNYGGILQAYALVQVIKKYGYTSEQIRYNKCLDASLYMKIKIALYNLTRGIYIKKIVNYINLFHVNKQIKIRQKEMDQFIKAYIPASNKVYNRLNIINSNNNYKCFVAGSDQIWSALSKTNLLDFVKKDKKKFSYAASIARDHLTSDQKIIMKKFLPNFQAVSVREEQSVKLLEEIGINSKWVLDPTMLLNVDEWNQICTERKVSEPYIFCYFLDLNKNLRRVATEYAKKRKLKIVTLPYLTKVWTKEDEQFGDMQFFDISPADFISLIRNAEFVITDSFHGTVFSYIYKRQFIVFERPPMNSRVRSLLSIYGNEERLFNCTEKGIVKELLKLPKIDYCNQNNSFTKLLKESECFLKKNLKEGLED